MTAQLALFARPTLEEALRALLPPGWRVHGSPTTRYGVSSPDDGRTHSYSVEDHGQSYIVRTQGWAWVTVPGADHYHRAHLYPSVEQAVEALLAHAAEYEQVLLPRMREWEAVAHGCAAVVDSRLPLQASTEEARALIERDEWPPLVWHHAVEAALASHVGGCPLCGVLRVLGRHVMRFGPRDYQSHMPYRVYPEQLRVYSLRWRWWDQRQWLPVREQPRVSLDIHHGPLGNCPNAPWEWT